MCILKTQKTFLLSFQENERGMDRWTDRHRYIQRDTEIEREGRRKGWEEGEGGDK